MSNFELPTLLVFRVNRNVFYDLRQIVLIPSHNRKSRKHQNVLLQRQLSSCTTRDINCYYGYYQTRFYVAHSLRNVYVDREQAFNTIYLGRGWDMWLCGRHWRMILSIVTRGIRRGEPPPPWSRTRQCPHPDEIVIRR